jgi:FtsH-binding integral membrane protein
LIIFGAVKIKLRSEKTDQMVKFLKILTWVLIILSIFAFYISLRSDEFSMEYAIGAMVLWILALGANYLIKKYKQ